MLIISDYEIDFDHTIDNKLTVNELADGGQAYDFDTAVAAQALRSAPLPPIFTTNWVLPKGAFGESSGPT